MDKIELAIYIGNIIRARRVDAGLKTEDLAEYLQLNRASIVNIELGRQNITSENLYKIACLFNVSVSIFFPDIVPVNYSIGVEEVEVKKLKKKRKVFFNNERRDNKA